MSVVARIFRSLPLPFPRGAGSCPGSDAGGLSPAQIRRMEGRELTAEDLEVLLAMAFEESSSAAAAANGSRRLSAQDFAALPKPSPDCVDLSGECSICLGEFDASGDLRMLPACGHVFHASCARDWLCGKQATCPLDSLDVRITK